MPPTIDIDMFDDAPKVGDKVKVMGKVKSIDEDSGRVTVSYDDASIVKKSKKRRNRDNDDDDDFDEVVVQEEVMPESQSLDQALAQNFGYTQ